MPITCPSSIVRVTVHGRGALVTRRLSVPGDLPDGDVELVAEGITVIADAGSVRAALVGDATGRSVVAVRSSVHVPVREPVTGPSVERVRELSARMDRLRAEYGALVARRDPLVGRPLQPVFRSASIEKRTADAVATTAMLSALVRELDARLVALEDTLRDLTREHDTAVLEDAQARTNERVGTGHPTRTVTVLLTGEGAVEAVDVTYAVAAARWWPVYTLRIIDNGKKARWWIEALVAQRSGEDWSAVRLALSTADLAFDARLPELPSLRLGKAQPPVGKGYRPPAPGLDRMFAGYERAFPTTLHSNTYSMMVDAMASQPATEGGDFGDLLEDGAPDMQAEELPAVAKSVSRSRGPSFALGGAMPVYMAAPAMPQRMSARNRVPGGGGAAPPPPPEVSDDRSLEPTDAWLDFDALSLGEPAGPRRGRLVLADASVGATVRASAVAAIESVTPPAGARDPVTSRGMFDHRYDADGIPDVPSDGQSHRVNVGTAEATPTMRWRTVPRESPEVYREAELRNPFDAPLLAGPVDVYVDGSLLAVAFVDRIDRGGTMHVGMGVEERVRVARNVRTTSESAGLLGGSTAVLHTVDIEVSSSLGGSTLVEVIDRIPVSDDKTVEVTVVSARPEPEAYTQADRGAPVRGGLLWRQIVPAGAKATLSHQYRITLPAKSEIVGGNRRE